MIGCRVAVPYFHWSTVPTPLFDNTAAACLLHLPVVEELIFCISATPYPGTSFPVFHGLPSTESMTENLLRVLWVEGRLEGSPKDFMVCAKWKSVWIVSECMAAWRHPDGGADWGPGPSDQIVTTIWWMRGVMTCYHKHNNTLYITLQYSACYQNHNNTLYSTV